MFFHPYKGRTMTRIIVRRERQFVDGFRKYKVILDGKRVGALRSGEKKEFETEPGRHSIQMAIDWGRSNTLEFNIGRDQMAFVCNCNCGGWRMCLGLLYATVWASKYLHIEIEG